MRDYDSNFTSANYKHCSEKEKHFERRRKASVKKLSRMKNAPNGYFGYYVKEERPVYKYSKEIIPEQQIPVYENLPIYDPVSCKMVTCSVFSGFRFVPEHELTKRRFLGVMQVKPYLKRINISGRRSFIKKQSNKAVRHTQIDCHEGFQEIGSNPGAYRKIYDYQYELY